jgi:hypothetical protein
MPTAEYVIASLKYKPCISGLVFIFILRELEHELCNTDFEGKVGQE